MLVLILTWATFSLILELLGKTVLGDNHQNYNIKIGNSHIFRIFAHLRNNGVAAYWFKGGILFPTFTLKI